MGNAFFDEIQAVLDHGFLSVGRDKSDGDAVCFYDPVQVAVLHGSRMECGYLVVVDVRSDECLGGEFAFQVLDIAARDTQLVEVPLVYAEIVTDGCHRVRILSEQAKVVGNVTCATTKLSAHLGHQERHIQYMYLVGKNVFLELVRKHHDGVVGHRSTD